MSRHPHRIPPNRMEQVSINVVEADAHVEEITLDFDVEMTEETVLAAAREAKKNYPKKGVVDYMPAISTYDPTAAMYGTI